jgi:hypothetical protein
MDNMRRTREVVLRCFITVSKQKEEEMKMVFGNGKKAVRLVSGAWALLAFALIVFMAGGAEAHLLVVSPDVFSCPVESSIKLTSGLSEPLLTMAYSREGLLARGHAGDPGVANLSGAIDYADGEKKVLGPDAFVPANLADPANANPASADVSVISFKVEKPGTVTVTASLSFNSGTRPTLAFGKTFLNRAADGAGLKRFGGDEVLEIVFTDDAASAAIKTGDTVNVGVFLRGKPLAGANVSATYDGAPRHEDSDEPDNNEYLHADTNAEGKTAFVVDRPGTWVIGVEYVDEAFDPRNPAYSPSKGVRYRGTVLFPVAAE